MNMKHMESKLSVHSPSKVYVHHLHCVKQQYDASYRLAGSFPKQVAN